MTEPINRTLRIDVPGGRTTIQDNGRPGRAEFGVGRSGAADRAAYALANRILGNPVGAAALETTLGGLRFSCDHPNWVTVTGPQVEVQIDGAQVGSHTAFFAAPGAQVQVGTPLRGLRNYVAVRGGIAVDPVLGSRSRDILGGIGPAELQTGDVLPIGSPPTSQLGELDVYPVAEPPAVVELQIDPGPRVGWFTDNAWQTLIDREYTVTFDSDRIGVRFDGPQLERAIHDELPSEGLMQGAVQIPTTGTPVVFLADQPTTGGYPVIAVVRRRSLNLLAQARPGSVVRFRPANFPAHQSLHARTTRLSTNDPAITGSRVDNRVAAVAPGWQTSLAHGGTAGRRG